MAALLIFEKLSNSFPVIFDFSKFEVMQDWYKKFAVLKFNFDTAQMQKVREYLHLCGVSYKTIYPDLEGLAKSVTENITV